jgi:hypothetical protein
MESIRNINYCPTSITVKQLWLIKYVSPLLFRDNQNTGDLIPDNNDLERGITIT